MNKLKDLRVGKGLSVRELGEKTNISFSTVSKLENGSQSFNAEYLDIFCKFFDVTADYILGNNPIYISKIKINEYIDADNRSKYDYIDDDNNAYEAKVKFAFDIKDLDKYLSSYDLKPNVLDALKKEINIRINYINNRYKRSADTSFALYGDVKDLTPEEIEDVKNYIAFKKSQRKN